MIYPVDSAIQCLNNCSLGCPQLGCLVIASRGLNERRAFVENLMRSECSTGSKPFAFSVFCAKVLHNKRIQVMIQEQRSVTPSKRFYQGLSNAVLSDCPFFILRCLVLNPNFSSKLPQ